VDRRRTKIVATLGPATNDPDMVGRLVDAGADVFRINFSHGERADHLGRLRLIQSVCAVRGSRVAILADLQGPKIRVGRLPDEGVPLVVGAQVELVAGVETAAPPAIPVVYEHLAKDVRPGDRILLDDGALELVVLGTDGDRVSCEVVRGGIVRSRKGVNLPGVAVSAPSLTDKDKADLAIAVEGDADYVALSFVRKPEDVLAARNEVHKLGGTIPIIAKLERPEAIDRLDDILAVSDGVMVARGDLGVEVAVEKVPSLQKEIIVRANSIGVPVITATQMLESMITNSRPTRAEASDVANAVFDGTDAVMLSGETAVGAYPVEAVEAMGRICDEAEATPHLVHPPPPSIDGLDVTATVCKSAVSAANDLHARLVVAFTDSGSTARFVSRFRPRTPIVGLTPVESTRRRMALFWGVQAPPRLDRGVELSQMIAQGDERLIEGGLAKPGDVVVVVAGPPGGAGGTNRMLVHVIGRHEEIRPE
jgi:pyruvate kinase